MCSEIRVMGKILSTFNVGHYVYGKSNFIFPHFDVIERRPWEKTTLRHKNHLEIFFGLRVMPKILLTFYGEHKRYEKSDFIFFSFRLEKSIEHGKMTLLAESMKNVFRDKGYGGKDFSRSM